MKYTKLGMINDTRRQFLKPLKVVRAQIEMTGARARLIERQYLNNENCDGSTDNVQFGAKWSGMEGLIVPKRARRGRDERVLTMTVFSRNSHHVLF